MNYRYGGKDAELLRYLEERVEKNPASSFFAMLSCFYLDAGKIAEALSIAQRGVIAHPNYSTGHVVLAMVMMKARLFYDARKELAKAGDLRPGSKIVESLTATLDKEEQADEIGKKLAEQFHKNRAGGKDLMKTIEETIELYRAKSGNDDFIIPGLDAIVGSEPSKIGSQLKAPTMVPSDEELHPKYSGIARNKEKIWDVVAKGENASTIAKAIIEKVSREMESTSPSTQEKSIDSSDLKGRREDDFSERSAEVAGTPAEPSSEASHPDVIEPPSSSSVSGSPPVYEPEEIESVSGDFDLDALAQELEAAGPIKPTEDHSKEHGDESRIDLTPEIVTETLAKIFEQQGQLKTAIEAYTILMQKKPEQAEIYQKKIAELTQRTNG
jgi:tetratricopeptide (TPR) repeat protein